ncbi:hypothetical protein D3C80_1215320 [compost metagenome]
MDMLSDIMPGTTPYRFGFNKPNYWSDPSGLFESWNDAISFLWNNNYSGVVNSVNGIFVATVTTEGSKDLLNFWMVDNVLQGEAVFQGGGGGGSLGGNGASGSGAGGLSSISGSSGSNSAGGGSSGGGYSPINPVLTWKSPIGLTLVALGQPIKSLKPIGALGSKPGSSIASWSLSKAIPQTFTSTLGKKAGTKVATTVGTNVIGRGLGRLAPGVGWGLLGYDFTTGIALPMAEGASKFHESNEQNGNWIYNLPH